MSPEWIQWLALSAAFWLALALHGAGDARRFALALVIGAAVAHLGWAALHADVVGDHPRALLDPGAGFCVLFVPLGPLLVSPGPAAFRALPLPLAVARLGCIAGGCCVGALTGLVEIAALAALHLVLRSTSAARVVPVFCLGFGALRLLTEPLRAAPPLGEPVFPVAWIATAWVLAGAAALPATGRLSTSAHRPSPRTRTAAGRGRCSSR